MVTDGDFDAAKASPIVMRSPFIEAQGNYKGVQYDGLKVLGTLASPRVIKTHLPYRFFEKAFRTRKPRVIVVMRNLKVRQTEPRRVHEGDTNAADRLRVRGCTRFYPMKVRLTVLTSDTIGQSALRKSMESIVSNQPPVPFQADREHDQSHFHWIKPRTRMIKWHCARSAAKSLGHGSLHSGGRQNQLL